MSAQHFYKNRPKVHTLVLSDLALDQRNQELALAFQKFDLYMNLLYRKYFQMQSSYHSPPIFIIDSNCKLYTYT
jgi:hypothetical protein